MGRWFNPDPYNQYHSPYLAMGNNPVSSVDPDGGQDSNSDYWSSMTEISYRFGHTDQFTNDRTMDAGGNWISALDGLEDFKASFSAYMRYKRDHYNSEIGEWGIWRENISYSVKTLDPQSSLSWESDQSMKPGDGFISDSWIKARWYSGVYDRRYERFKERNPNATQTDFIYHNVNKRWYKNYERYSVTRSTNWDYYRKTTMNPNPPIAFKRDIGDGTGQNSADMDINVGVNSGYLILDMDAFGAKDRFQIIDPSSGRVIFDTKKSVREFHTSGEIRFSLKVGTTIRVRVNPNGNFSPNGESNTVWTYSIFVDTNKGIRNRLLIFTDVSQTPNPR